MASMSDENESFLARWSKRKALARVGPDPDEAERKQPQRSDLAAPADAGAVAGGGAPEDEPEIALEDLPPIESIDASTDLTPWLKKKIPDVWRQAALKRAWTADPAISQFIGLAENSWDWNAPDGVPGFGPLRPTDNVVQLLSQVIGPAPGNATLKAEELLDKAEELPVATTESSPPELGSPDRGQPEMPKEASTDAFAYNAQATPSEQPGNGAESDAVDEPPVTRRRRGGGALPS
jgi:hypothetical protein